MAFRAEDDDEAHEMIDDEEGSIRSDLKVLVGTGEKPLWDGNSAIVMQEATAAQHAEWEQSRDQAIADCVSAWNKDPVFGVIGIQSGPRH